MIPLRSALALLLLSAACATTATQQVSPTSEPVKSTSAVTQRPQDAEAVPAPQKVEVVASGGETVPAALTPVTPEVKPGLVVTTCSAAGKTMGGFSVIPGDQPGFGMAARTEQDALNMAAARSKKDLRDRICGEEPCHSVEAAMRLVHAGPMASPHFCAMTLVPEKTVAAHFKAVKGSPLDEQLAQVVEALYAHFEQTKARGEISIDKVIDHGHAGTPRSNFLKDRLARALYDRKQVLIASLPRAWSGQTVPRGFRAVISATVASRGTDGRRVDVSWRALVHGPRNTSRTLPLTVTTLAVDELPAGTMAGSADDRTNWPKDPSLKVRIDAAPGGSLCPGELTQLTAWSAKDRHVQIYSLFGDGRAMLLYPRAGGTPADLEGLLGARADVPIGGEEGFIAQPLKGENEELFLVLGSESAGAFGDSSRWKGPCVVPPDFARRLWKPDALPASLVKSSESYRIVQGSRCEGVTPVEPITTAQLLSAWPTCE